MARVSGRSSKAKRRRAKPVSARQRRKAIQKSQLRIRKKTLEVKRPVSMRGTTHLMEAPGMEQPQTPQNVVKQSEAIKRFKYWTEEKRLRIWFTTNHVYDYFNVPESVVLDLSQAQSKGRYFHQNIYGEWVGKSPHKQLKYEYRYVRIR